MTVFVNLALSILCPCLAGYGCLLLLFPRKALPLSMHIALAYGLGLGLLSVWMLGLYMARQPFDLLTLQVPLLVTAVLTSLLSLKKTPLKTAEAAVRVRTRESGKKQGLAKILYVFFLIILWAYLVQTSLFVVWRSMLIPVYAFDAISTVALKAKVFYFQRIPLALHLLPHRTYPLFTPFMESWVAFNLGQWDDVLVKIIFPCAFPSFLVIHYKFLGHFTNRTWALLGSVILLSSNLFIFHATISYRDFFLMYFNCSTIMLLIFFNESRASAFLVLAGLFAGFASFTKLEGASFLAVYIILLALITFRLQTFSGKEKLHNFLKFCVPSVGISAAFSFYKIANHVFKDGPGALNKTGFDLSWEKALLLPQIMAEVLTHLLRLGNWNIIWLLVLLSLFQVRKKWERPEVKLISWSLLLFFGLYIGVAVATANYIWIAGAKSSSTLSRLILHFFPLAVILIALLNYSEISEGRKNTSSLNPK